MAIDFSCQFCGRTYHVAETLAGKRTRCKDCQEVITIPEPPPLETPPARSATRPPLQSFGAAPKSRPPLQAFGSPPAQPSSRPAPPPIPEDVYGVAELGNGPAALPPQQGLYDDDDDDRGDEIARPQRPGRRKTSKSSRAQFAGFWRRFCAAIIDGILLGILQLAVYFCAGVALGFYCAAVAGRPPGPSDIAAATMYAGLLNLVLCVLYLVGMVASSHQGTVGKVAMGIKVCDTDGNRLSFGMAFVRELARILSGIPLGAGYIMAAFTERKQALHDILVHTYVIRN